MTEVLEEHESSLLRYAIKLTGDPDRALDLVQEAFVKLWNNCHKILPNKAKSFLFTVATNKMINELSKKKTVLKYARQIPKDYTHESPEFVMEENEYIEINIVIICHFL